MAKRKKRSEKRTSLDERLPDSGALHPAGPHARPELTDEDATPGTGALPEPQPDGDVDPGTG